MAGVGGEAHLGLIALVNALQHGVDRLPQRGQLLAAGDGHMVGQGLGVHPLQLPGQLAQLAGIQRGVLQTLRCIGQRFQRRQHRLHGAAAAPERGDQQHDLDAAEHQPLPQRAVKAQHDHRVDDEKAHQGAEKAPGDIASGGRGALGQPQLSG